MRRICSLIVLAALFSFVPARAQLTRDDLQQNLTHLAPNDAGVTNGLWYTIVRDVDAAKQFWQLMGGSAVKLDGIDAMKFHGVFVLLKQGEAAVNNDGSIVDHPGFRIPNARTFVAKLKAAGVRTDPGAGERKGGFYIYTPDGLKIELIEDENLAIPIVSDHVHFAVPEAAVDEMQAWYVKAFGARAFLDSVTNPAKPTVSANIPGAQLKFGKSTRATLPTHGRMLDHIGFEVTNLDEFCRKLQAAGISFDQPLSDLRHGSYRSATITDPWGTSIELTQGLGK